MKWKVLLAAFLLLSTVFVVAAVNQLLNEESMSPSEMIGIVDQPPNETNPLPSAMNDIANQQPNETDTEPLLNETNASSNDSIILEKVFNETFKLTMIIPKDTYALGEPANITLRLTNLSNESVTIYYNWMSLLAYSVLNPSGDLIYYKTEVPGEITLPTLVDETMEPNMAHEKLFVWRQVYTGKFYYTGTYRDVEYLITTPGTYTIVGRARFYLSVDVYDVYEAKLQVEIQII